MLYLVDPMNPKLNACTTRWNVPLYGIPCKVYAVPA
jgi:hypothetical protein